VTETEIQEVEQSRDVIFIVGKKKSVLCENVCIEPLLGQILVTYSCENVYVIVELRYC
jgi:hypothetical protein